MKNAWQLEPIYFAPLAKLGGGWICLKDSGSPPPAPDYRGAAQETAAGNLEAARFATRANRVDQYTPYGSLVYTQNQPGVFDEAGYNAAMEKWNSWQPGQAVEGAQVEGGGSLSSLLDRVRENGPGGSSGPLAGRGPAPDKSAFMSGADPDSWRSDINLSPVGQELLDYYNQSSIGLGKQTGRALERVDESLSQPFDLSSVQDVADRSYEAETARLDPQWRQFAGQNDAKLANQGIMRGSEAYNDAQRTFMAGQNDAYSGARRNAIATMPQTFQLASSARSRSLNELNALRTGSQVQVPQFTNAPQQGQTAGANFMDATKSQGAYDQSVYNADVASGNAETSQIMSLVAAAAMAY